MTGTLSGYLVHRLQDSIKRLSGRSVPYSNMAAALTVALMELDKDLAGGDCIELPSGRQLVAGRRMGNGDV